MDRFNNFFQFMRKNFISFGVVFLVGVNVHAAGFSLQVKDNSLSASQKKAVENMLAEVEAVLPAKLKNIINRPIFVEFGLGVKGTDFLVPACSWGQLNTAKKVRGAKKQWKKHTEKFGEFIGASHEVYSRVKGSEKWVSYKQRKKHKHSATTSKIKRFRIKGDANTIQITKSLLPAIVGKADDEVSPCYHKSTYQWAKAAVVNGLARLYDVASKSPEEKAMLLQSGMCFQDSEVKKSLSNMEVATGYYQAGTNRNKKVPKAQWDAKAYKCYELARSRFMLSDRPKYLKRGDWGDKSEPLSQLFPRGLNRFEYADDSASHLAYNIEYFVLDSEFACRKPAMHSFLAKHFGEDTQARFRKCDLNTKIPYIRRAQKFIDENNCPLRNKKGDCIFKGQTLLYSMTFDLDPMEVFEIHAFRAGSGDGMVSSFGHSAFRVLICPEETRKNRPEDCLVDDSLSMVVNYRANTMGLKIDTFKGLGFSDNYETQLFMTPVHEYFREYGTTEVRNIFSSPLKNNIGSSKKPEYVSLTTEQKEDFIYTSLERYWNYMGTYNFLFNNCANDAISHAQSSLDNNRLNLENPFILTPRGADEMLNEAGLLNNEQVEKIEKRVDRKVDTWEKYHKVRSLLDKSPQVFTSEAYDIEDSLYFILDNYGLIEKLQTPLALKGELEDWLEAPLNVGGKPRIVKIALQVLDEWKADKELMNGASHVSQQVRAVLKKVEELDAEKGNMKQAEWEAYYLAQAQNIVLYDLLLTNKTRVFVVLKHTYRVYNHMHNVMEAELTDKAITAACKIIDCSKIEDEAEKGFNVDTVLSQDFEELTKDKKAELDSNVSAKRDFIKSMAIRYYQLKQAERPFRSYSAEAGYGIPLKSEVADKNQLLKVNYLSRHMINQLYFAMEDEVGPSFHYVFLARAIRNGLLEKIFAAAKYQQLTH